MTTIDEQIGRNLAALRREISQRDLAAEMKARGWKWTHVTVGAVERGERPLRLSEARAVLDILGVDSIRGTSVLTSPDPNTELFLRLREMARLAKKLEEAGSEFIEAQVELAVIATSTDISPFERKQAESWLTMTAGMAAMEAAHVEKPPTAEEIAARNAGHPFLQLLNETYGEHPEAP